MLCVHFRQCVVFPVQVHRKVRVHFLREICKCIQCTKHSKAVSPHFVAEFWPLFEICLFGSSKQFLSAVLCRSCFRVAFQVYIMMFSFFWIFQRFPTMSFKCEQKSSVRTFFFFFEVLLALTMLQLHLTARCTYHTHFCVSSRDVSSAWRNGRNFLHLVWQLLLFRAQEESKKKKKNKLSEILCSKYFCLVNCRLLIEDLRSCAVVASVDVFFFLWNFAKIFCWMQVWQAFSHIARLECHCDDRLHLNTHSHKPTTSVLPPVQEINKK